MLGRRVVARIVKKLEAVENATRCENPGQVFTLANLGTLQGVREQFVRFAELYFGI
jgi:hypothetical protein